jgi:hypothetical protein
MSQRRIERILYKLAQRHAPHLTPPGWEQDSTPTERVARLARKLADYGALVLVGDLPPVAQKLPEVHIHDWIQTYGRLYQILVYGLFPSLKQIEAFYADDHLPVVAVMEGDAAPVLGTFAGYIVPYVALRQGKSFNQLEVEGLLNVIFDELEAGDLPGASLEALRESCVSAIRQILNATVKHISLTTLDRRVDGMFQVEQSPDPVPEPATPQPIAPDPPPDVPGQTVTEFDLDYLPEDDLPPTPTEQMFSVRLPLPKSGSKRMPPVPRLPDEDEKDEDDG